MDIKVTRDMTGKMRHIVHVRQHAFAVDESEALGGEDSGPTPHDLYDAALGACKALTVLWYAKRKQIPVEDIEVFYRARRLGRAQRHLPAPRDARNHRSTDLRAAAGIAQRRREVSGAQADVAGHHRDRDRLRSRRVRIADAYR